MAQINVRIDEDVKSSAELLFSRLEQIKADFDNGMRNYHSHELIEERTYGKALA